MMDTNDMPENPGRKPFESVRDAVETARKEAGAMAKDTAPKLKAAVAEVVYDIAYGAAFGTFFAGTFANELLPRQFKDCLAKGAAAGRSAARKACEKAGNAMRLAPAPAAEVLAIGCEPQGA